MPDKPESPDVSPIDKKARDALAAYNRELEKSDDLASSLVKSFEQINKLHKEGRDSMGKMADFSNRILSDTKARGIIERRVLSDIEDAEDAIIASKAEEFRISQKIQRSVVEQALMQKMVARVENDRRENDEERADLSKKLLALELDMNDAQLRAIHNEEDLSDEYANMIKQREDLQAKIIENGKDGESILKRELAIRAQMPEAIKAQLDHQRRVTEQAEKELKARQQLLKDVRLQSGYMAHMEKSGYSTLGAFGGIVTKSKEFSQNIKVIPLRFMTLDLLIKSAIDRFVALDKAAEEFRKQSGFSVTQMKDLRENAEKINVEFASMGVNIENVYNAAKALTDVFGRTSLVSEEALKNVSLLSANLGVAEEHSANVLATFQGLGGASEQAAMNVIKVGAGISEKAGVPFKLVMQDVANASEETLSMLGANPSKLMKSAIAARSMGLELNKLVASQRKLLDFSSSINDEMEASALLGRNVNFQLSRQLAFEGRVEDAARATLETVKNAGDFNAMNVYQREALAKAAGMELKDLTKMMAQDAKREAILKGNDEAKKATLKAQEKELENLKKINDLDKEDLVAANEKALLQQKMQGLMTKLSNAISAMAVSIGSVFEPIITPLVDVVVPVFQFLAWSIGWIAKGLSWILAPVRGIASGIAAVANGTASWTKGVDVIKDQFKDLKTTIGSLIQFAGAGVLTYLFFGRGGLGKTIGMIKKPFIMAKDTIMGMFKKGPIDPSKGLTDVSKGAEKAPSKSGVKSFLSDLAAGLKKMGSGKVLLGAFNLIPASIGLIAMIPGFVGAKLLENIDGKALKKSLEGLAAGLSSMGTGRVLLGSLALVAAAAGLAVMLIGIPAILAVSFLGEAFSVGLIAMSAGLAALGGNPFAWLGIAAIIALSGAFALFGLGVKLMAEGLATVINSFSVFADLEWETIAKGFTTMLGLGFVAAVLGAALPLIIAGAAGILIIGGAMVAFGEIMKIAAPGLESLSDLFDRISEVDGDALMNTAKGIAAVGIALGSFGAGSAVSGIGSFVGKFLGGDPIEKMQKLADMGAQLKMTAESIQSISAATANFGAVDAFTSTIDKLTISLTKLNETIGEMSTIKLAALSVISSASGREASAPTETTTTASTDTTTTASTDTIGAKLDELIGLMKNGAIAVNLDGRKVSTAMATSARE